MTRKVIWPFLRREAAKYDSPREVVSSWVEALCSPTRATRARTELAAMERQLRAQLDDPQLRKVSQTSLKRVALIRQRAARCAALAKAKAKAVRI